jgi:hypothetical protein
MSAPKTCFSYYEEERNPGVGAGYCLQEHYINKKTGIPETHLCGEILGTKGCPRKHGSPYLREGERA